MVLVLVVIFACCWLPIHCVHLRNDFGQPPYTFVYYIIKIVAHCMSYANSAINPIIYSFMNESFRKAFKATICCKPLINGKIFVVVQARRRGSRSNSSDSRRAGRIQSRSDDGNSTASGKGRKMKWFTEKFVMRRLTVNSRVNSAEAGPSCSNPCPPTAL